MQLNIYKVSHPIIQIILNQIKYYNNQNEKNYYYKYIGLLLIYEMLRKYVQTNNIYIKRINDVKKITLSNYKTKYLILTDISKTYDMITDIKTVLPNLEIINIGDYNIKEIEYSIKHLVLKSKDTNIFIIEKTTSNNKIIKLIEYLKYNQNISTKNIIIGSITSYHETLIQIGNYYPELNIYTAEIKKKI